MNPPTNNPWVPARVSAFCSLFQLVDFGRQQAADRAAAQWDAFVARKRRFYLDDPAMPAFLRGWAAAAWDYFEPHVKDEFVALVEFEVGLRKRRAFQVCRKDDDYYKCIH